MNANNSKIWAKLCFNAWEGMAWYSLPVSTVLPSILQNTLLTAATDIVLMYCTFVSLKARNLRTLQCGPKELALGKEKELFQAYGP